MQYLISRRSDQKVHETRLSKNRSIINRQKALVLSGHFDPAGALKSWEISESGMSQHSATSKKLKMHLYIKL